MNASSSSSAVRRPPVLLDDDTRFTCHARRDRVYRCDNVDCRREVTFDRKLGFNGTWCNPAARGHRFAALQSLWENGEDMRFYCVPCFMKWYSVETEREMQKQLGIGADYENHTHIRDAERVQRFLQRTRA